MSGRHGPLFQRENKTVFFLEKGVSSVDSVSLVLTIRLPFVTAISCRR